MPWRGAAVVSTGTSTAAMIPNPATHRCGGPVYLITHPVWVGTCNGIAAAGVPDLVQHSDLLSLHIGVDHGLHYVLTPLFGLG